MYGDLVPTALDGARKELHGEGGSMGLGDVRAGNFGSGDAANLQYGSSVFGRGAPQDGCGAGDAMLPDAAGAAVVCDLQLRPMGRSGRVDPSRAPCDGEFVAWGEDAASKKEGPPLSTVGAKGLIP